MLEIDQILKVSLLTSWLFGLPPGLRRAASSPAATVHCLEPFAQHRQGRTERRHASLWSASQLSQGQLLKVHVMTTGKRAKHGACGSGAGISGLRRSVVCCVPLPEAIATGSQARSTAMQVNVRPLDESGALSSVAASVFTIFG